MYGVIIQHLAVFIGKQIGKFVRVQQLIGSNTTQDFDGFLIGVGINYIILQEYANQDIRILDIYGIKQMYVYYSETAAVNISHVLPARFKTV